MAEKTIVEKLQLTKYKEAVILNQPNGADYFQNLANYEEKTSRQTIRFNFRFCGNARRINYVRAKSYC